MKRPIPWYIAIGASGSDGLNDIRSLLSLLQKPLRATVLVVLHRPWEGPTNLASVLARSCPHPVRIASENEHLEPGCVYIGEPAEHLTLIANNLGTIIVDPTKLHRNRTVDLLFKSVAEHGREHMIGVVLSGSLDDGSRGLAAIHHAGGLTMVLLPSRPGRTDMRNNAIEFDGPIDVIGSARDIAAAIESAIGLEIEGMDLAPADRG